MISFLILVVVLIFLCLLPVRIGFAGRCFEGQDLFGRGWLRPCCGLVGVQVVYAEEEATVSLMVLEWTIWSFRPGKGKQSSKPRSKEAHETDEEEESLTLGERFDLLRERLELLWAYWGRLKVPLGRFLGRMYRMFRLRRLSGLVVYGAGDPATTGKHYGYALAVLGVTGRRFRVRVIPDFERGRVEGEGEVDAWLYPHRFVWALGCFGVRVGVAWGALMLAKRRQARAVVVRGDGFRRSQHVG